MTPGLDPVMLTEIRMRAEAPIPRHRLRQADRDVRWLIGHVDRVTLDLNQTREAKASALLTNHICRDHHALYHADCTKGGAA